MAAALAALLGACGSEPDEGDVAIEVPFTTSTTTVPSTSPASAPPTTPPTTVTAGTVATADFSATTVSVPGRGETALLGAVRAARQPGFDRVVFEFSGPVPGYEVGYVDRPVREDGSGREVTVTGAAVLQVRMSPASGAEVSPSGVRQTYTGPERIRPTGTGIVAEVVRVGDFEAQLTWVVGTSGRVPFRVTTFGSPSRLVVDLRG